MPRVRFRMRTLLLMFAAAVVLIGSLRWWHDVRLAEYRRQEAIAETLERGGAEILWVVDGTEWVWRVLDERLLTSVTHVSFDYVPEDQVAEFTKLLPELGDLYSVLVLGRQIVPDARLSVAGEASPMIEALRRSSVQRVMVDASIRGAPLNFDASPYTRDDLKVLEAVLPEREIDWIEVN